MKTLLIFSLSISLATVNAQLAFTEHQENFESVLFYTQSQFSKADIDNNGYNDWVYGYDDYTGAVIVKYNEAGEPGLVYSAMVDYLCGSLATGDMNGDEIPDIVTYHAGAQTIEWLEKGAGPNDFTAHLIFSDVQASKNDVYVSDLDGDGTSDIIIKTRRDITCFYNDGLGSFTTDTIEHHASDYFARLKICDFDGDGDPDLLMTEMVTWSMRLLRNDGGAGFSDILINDDCDWYEMNAADIDHDGDVDLVGNCDYITKIIRNDSIAFPVIQTLSNAWDYVFADFTGDSYPDLLAEDHTLLLFTNQGDGTFSDRDTIFDVTPTYDECCYLTEPDDIDHDGDMDIITFYSPYHSWLENNLNTFVSCDSVSVTSVVEFPDAIDAFWPYGGSGEYQVILTCITCIPPEVDTFYTTTNYINIPLTPGCDSFLINVNTNCDGVWETGMPYSFSFCGEEDTVVANITTADFGIINCYPNPNNGNFNIQIPYSNHEITVEIFSSGGQLIYRKQFDNISSNEKIEIKTEGYEGPAFIRAYNNNHYFTGTLFIFKN